MAECDDRIHRQRLGSGAGFPAHLCGELARGGGLGQPAGAILDRKQIHPEVRPRAHIRPRAHAEGGDECGKENGWGEITVLHPVDKFS